MEYSRISYVSSKNAYPISGSTTAFFINGKVLWVTGDASCVQRAGVLLDSRGLGQDLGHIRHISEE